MKYRFITILHFLKLERPGCRIPLQSGMITNKSDLIGDILNYRSRLALRMLGTHSIDEFINTTYYLLEGELDSSWTTEDINRYGTQMTFAFLRQIQFVTNKLWFIKDNSVYVRDGFLFVYDGAFDDGLSFKASMSTVNSLANTNVQDVVFSKEEIISAADDMVIISPNSLKEDQQDYKLATQFQYFKGANLDRKTYAFFYILFARSMSAIPVKILMYVTAMEALVSTTTIELSHQVSERVAVLIENNSEERKAIYTTIKKAYGYRSKAAHGESLKGSEDEYKELLIVIDGYLRRLLKIDEPYSFDDNKMNTFFLEKLMA